MKIWYLSAYDQPEGHSSRTFWYASEFAKRGHQVTMFTNSYCHFTHTERFPSIKKWKIEYIDNVRVVWLSTIAYGSNGWKRGINMLQNAYRALQFAKNTIEVPDVVIGPSVPILTGWAASRIAIKKKAAFIYEVRDIWPQALVDLGKIKKGGFVEIIFKKIEKFLYMKSCYIVSAMPQAYLHIEKYGVGRDKVKWIPNGVDLNLFEGLEDYAGGKQNCLRVSYLGRFAAGHDIDIIVNCANLLQGKYKHKIKFTLIGDGPEKSKYQNKVNSLELNNVEFEPFIPKKEIPHRCSEADVLLACIQDLSVFNYGINLNKLYDYFASGRPIILSSNAPNDPVTEAGAGVRVKAEDSKSLANAIISFYNMTPQQRSSLGKNAKSYAKKFYDKRLLANKYEIILKNCIKKGF